MVREGTLYRFVSDRRGSPRLIIDTGSGAIVQQIDYDEFGRVLEDSNPGFQPFGFGGGLSDPQTGLVRLHARDYDPETGHFTTPDPVGYAAGTNLYLYVSGDPINRVDPSGLSGFPDIDIGFSPRDLVSDTLCSGAGYFSAGVRGARAVGRFIDRHRHTIITTVATVGAIAGAAAFCGATVGVGCLALVGAGAATWNLAAHQTVDWLSDDEYNLSVRSNLISSASVFLAPITSATSVTTISVTGAVTRSTVFPITAGSAARKVALTIFASSVLKADAAG